MLSHNQYVQSQCSRWSQWDGGRADVAAPGTDPDCLTCTASDGLEGSLYRLNMGSRCSARAARGRLRQGLSSVRCPPVRPKE